MSRRLAPLMLTLALPGCALLDPAGSRAEAPDSDTASEIATEIAAPVETTPLIGAGQSPAALDQTSEADKQAALAAPAAGGETALGTAVVALGPPAEQGLWVQSPLVKARAQGRVVAPGGQSLAVELRPGTGGALMSLAAYQALGIGLTELPEITLYGP